MHENFPVVSGIWQNYRKCLDVPVLRIASVNISILITYLQIC